MRQLHAFTICHIYCEANRVEDFLAHRGHCVTGIIVYDSPPLGVDGFLFLDVVGTSISRL